MFLLSNEFVRMHSVCSEADSHGAFVASHMISWRYFICKAFLKIPNSIFCSDGVCFCCILWQFASKNVPHQYNMIWKSKCAPEMPINLWPAMKIDIIINEFCSYFYFFLTLKSFKLRCRSHHPAAQAYATHSFYFYCYFCSIWVSGRMVNITRKHTYEPFKMIFSKQKKCEIFVGAVCEIQSMRLQSLKYVYWFNLLENSLVTNVVLYVRPYRLSCLRDLNYAIVFIERIAQSHRLKLKFSPFVVVMWLCGFSVSTPIIPLILI